MGVKGMVTGNSLLRLHYTGLDDQREAKNNYTCYVNKRNLLTTSPVFSGNQEYLVSQIGYVM